MMNAPFQKKKKRDPKWASTECYASKFHNAAAASEHEELNKQ